MSTDSGSPPLAVPPVIRQVGPATLVVEAAAPPSSRIAFHLYRGRERIRTLAYGRSSTARFESLAPGRYTCRVFTILPGSTSRAAVSTAPCVLTDRAVTGNSAGTAHPGDAPPRTGTVFIYGSCVARDTFGRMDDSRRLAGYVARQSLISAFSPPTSVRPSEPLPSPFQHRMLVGDLESSLPRTIEEHGRAAALLLIDLIDERLGVYQLADGAWVTNSGELRRTDTLTSTEHSDLVPFGTDQHFELWRPAFDQLVERIGPELARRTVVIEAPFATRTAEGPPVPAFAGRPAEYWNAAYERYYAHVRRSPLATVRIPDEYVLSTIHHRWHPDPYHYVDGAYDAVLALIERSIASGRGISRS